MADEPIEELGGKTPLEVANTPYMDKLAARGELGLAQTVMEGFPPGSDVANMSVLGLNPAKYYSGRAPIEAVSLDIPMSPSDTVFRINLVTLGQRDDDTILEDYCADHITTEEAHELVASLKEAFEQESGLHVYPGIEYRHILVIENFESEELLTTPPHDIIGEPTKDYLPNNEQLTRLIEKSREILRDHPVNIARRKQGKREANAIWPWGEGHGYNVPTLKEEYQISGAMISAVDLLKGLGKLRGMEVINVPGATGWIDTNYSGKASAAIEALSRVDLVYVHVEAPDEAGHGGLLREKIKAIEDFDQMVVGQILTGIEEADEPFRVLFLPDHPTPIALRTHTSKPVPYAIYDSTNPQKHNWKFTEKDAEQSGIFVKEGYKLLERLINPATS